MVGDLERIGRSVTDQRIRWTIPRVRTDWSTAFGVDWLRLLGGIGGVGDDFCISLGSKALYINFLRGFSVLIRSVLTGASEDGFSGTGRGKALSGRSRGSSFAAVRAAVSGDCPDAEEGRGGFVKAGESELGGLVGFGARGFSFGGRGGLDRES